MIAVTFAPPMVRKTHTVALMAWIWRLVLESTLSLCLL